MARAAETFEALEARVCAVHDVVGATRARSRACRLESRLIRWRLGLTLDDVWRRRNREAHEPLAKRQPRPRSHA